MTRTFGPSAEMNPDGTITTYCMVNGLYCFLHYHTACGAEKPPREFTPEERHRHIAPDWCKYRDQIIADAREAEDFRRFGLTGLSRPELMARAKQIPAEFRPSPMNKANALRLRKAIRAALVAPEK